MSAKFRPKPLTARPSLLDRIEYAFQWTVSWFIVDIPDHPCVSGFLTGLLLIGPIVVGSVLLRIIF